MRHSLCRWLTRFACCRWDDVSTRERVILIEYVSPTSDPCYSVDWRTSGDSQFRRDLCANVYRSNPVISNAITVNKWINEPCEFYARTPNSAFGGQDGSIDCSATAGGVASNSNTGASCGFAFSAAANHYPSSHKDQHAHGTPANYGFHSNKQLTELSMCASAVSTSCGVV